MPNNLLLVQYKRFVHVMVNFTRLQSIINRNQHYHCKANKSRKCNKCLVVCAMNINIVYCEVSL